MCVSIWKALYQCLVKAVVFPVGHVLMWELDYKESWVSKNWCFWNVVLEKTLESPLDCKEIPPVHPKENQSWIFIGRTDVKAETPVLRSPDEKNWLIGKDPDVGKDWRWKENQMIEDEVVGWHCWLNVQKSGNQLYIYISFFIKVDIFNANFLHIVLFS